MRTPLAALALALLLCACSTSGATQTASSRTPAPGGPPINRTSWIVGGDGRAVGQATFVESPNGVLIHLEFAERALPPGWHGLHLHARGDCTDAAAGFQASGMHVGMNRRTQHGLMNPAGPEAGDLPNIFAPPAGLFAAEMFNPHVTLQSEPQGRRVPLLDDDGSALIVHASRDDYVTQPIGGAGARIACSALTITP